MAKGTPMQRHAIVLETLQIYLTSETDLYFNFVSNCTKQTFESIKSKNGLNIEFNNLPNVIANMLTLTYNSFYTDPKTKLNSISAMRELVFFKFFRKPNTRDYNCWNWASREAAFKKHTSPSFIGSTTKNQSYQCWKTPLSPSTKFWVARTLHFCISSETTLASMNDYTFLLYNYHILVYPITFWVFPSHSGFSHHILVYPITFWVFPSHLWVLNSDVLQRLFHYFWHHLSDLGLYC